MRQNEKSTNLTSIFAWRQASIFIFLLHVTILMDDLHFLLMEYVNDVGAVDRSCYISSHKTF